MSVFTYDKHPWDTLDVLEGDCCMITTDNSKKPFKANVSWVEKYTNHKGGYSSYTVYFKELPILTEIRTLKVLRTDTRSSRKLKYKKALYKWLLTYKWLIYVLLVFSVTFMWISVVSMTEPQIDFLEDYERTLRVISIYLGGFIVISSIACSGCFIVRIKKFLERKLKELENVY
jgi:hypothetical protein